VETPYVYVKEYNVLGRCFNKLKLLNIVVVTTMLRSIFSSISWSDRLERFFSLERICKDRSKSTIEGRSVTLVPSRTSSVSKVKGNIWECFCILQKVQV